MRICKCSINQFKNSRILQLSSHSFQNEEDGLQDDPFGELADEDGSFDENSLPDMEATSTNLTLDEIVDPGILIDDIKCEPVSFTLESNSYPTLQ